MEIKKLYTKLEHLENLLKEDKEDEALSVLSTMEQDDLILLGELVTHELEKVIE